jgi:hypothetical protein
MGDDYVILEQPPEEPDGDDQEAGGGTTTAPVTEGELGDAPDQDDPDPVPDEERET